MHVLVHLNTNSAITCCAYTNPLHSNTFYIVLYVKNVGSEGQEEHVQSEKPQITAHPRLLHAWPQALFPPLPWKRHFWGQHSYSSQRKNSVRNHSGHRSVLKHFVNTFFCLDSILSLWFLSHNTIMIHYTINYFKTKELDCALKHTGQPWKSQNLSTNEAHLEEIEYKGQLWNHTV